MRFLISGGGTGGHIFPAISIANALCEYDKDCQILFVGANGRMEMERIPAAGYDIVGLDVRGLERKKLHKNFKIIYDFWKSYLKAKKIVKDFSPDAAVGVGGYVSGAAMWGAASLGVPVILQEQNSFAGVTNRFLAKKSNKICVAYEGMDRFFPKEKIIFTGNPIRQNLLKDISRQEAVEHFGLESDKKVLLIVGGSLGAKTINDSILANIEYLMKQNFQIIWQTGKLYFANIAKQIRPIIKNITEEGNTIKGEKIFISDFINRMDYAYNCADLVVSRAGASSISELSLLGKPSILVPSPNVSENHQYHNAMALVNKEAAILVEDKDAEMLLAETITKVMSQEDTLSSLRNNIMSMAMKNSADKIAQVVLSEIQ